MLKEELLLFCFDFSDCFTKYFASNYILFYLILSSILFYFIQ